MAKTQKELVIKYLKDHGKITSYEAVLDLGILELPKRICQLQDDGYEFDKTWKTKKNRYGVSTSYVEYRLKEKG